MSRHPGLRSRLPDLPVLPLVALLGTAACAQASPFETQRAREGRLAPDLAEALPILEAAAGRGCAERPAGLPAGLRVDAACRVQAAVVAQGDAGALAERIRAGGGSVTRVGGDPPTLQAWLPPALLRALGEDGAVAVIRPPRYGRALPAGASPAR